MATLREPQDEQMDRGAAIEWAQVDDAHVVVAVPHTAWLCELQPLGSADPWALPVTGPGQTGTTTRLLSGCFSAAVKLSLTAPEPVIDSCPPALA